MLGKNNKCLEDRRDVEHESGVVPEGLNVTLIAGIEEDRPILSVEEVVVQQVALLESSIISEVEVVKLLFNVGSFKWRNRRVSDWQTTVVVHAKRADQAECT